MKKFVWILAAASAILFAACEKYDDSAILSEIQALKDRVSAVEKTLNETVVPGLSELGKKLDAKLAVTSISKKEGSYEINFSDNTSVTIANGKDGITPVIGIVNEDGIYYWTINGTVVTDSDGNKIPVASAGPVFRASEAGLEYSVDGGKTWNEVTGKATVELEETDEAYVLVFGETRITLPKAQAFTLKVQAPGTLVIPFGETVTLAYTILGAGDNEITEVDILNNGQGFDAEIEAETGAKGSISITNRTNSADAVIKVFVYATNHTGKSDIKAIVYKAEQGDEPIEVTFEAVLDAELVPAAGGEIHLSVNSDEAYSVSTDADWISVNTTKAIYEDVLLVTVAENKLTEQRSAVITVASKVSDKVKTLAVLQEAAEEQEDPELAGITLREDWVINYEGNYDYTHTDGTVETCDLISYTGLGTQAFITDYYYQGFAEENFDSEKAFIKAWIDLINRNIDAGATAEDLDVMEPTADPYGIIFDLFDPGAYEIYVIACDANGVPTGEYAKGEFEIDDPQVATDAYNSWIGVWTINATMNNKTSKKTFYITSKWNNESYNVYGFDDDYSFKVPVAYNAAADEIEFRFSHVETYGSTSFYFMGYTSEGYIAYGDPDNDNRFARLYKNGSSYKIEAIQYTARYQDGSTANIKVAAIGILGYDSDEEQWYSYSDLNYIMCPNTNISKQQTSAALHSAASRSESLKLNGHRPARRAAISMDARKSVVVK